MDVQNAKFDADFQSSEINLKYGYKNSYQRKCDRKIEFFLILLSMCANVFYLFFEWNLFLLFCIGNQRTILLSYTQTNCILAAKY
jgi:hypothetical protein